MTTFIHHLAPAGARGAESLREAARRPGPFARAFAALRRRRHARATRRMLAALDDATLRDIGVHPSEIDSVVAEIYADATPSRRRTGGAGTAPTAT